MITDLITNTDTTDRAQWLAERKGVIGSSDIGTLAGLNPYSTPLNVYLDKIEGREIEETQAMKMGRMLEPVILALAAEELGAIITSNAALVTHPDVAYFGCTPDGYIYECFDDDVGAGDFAIVEAKSTSKDIDEPERAHIVQLMWQIGVTGATRGYLAYLVRGRDFKLFPVERDEQLIADLYEIGHDFYERHLVPKIPPAPHTPGDVVLLHPRHTDGKSIEAADEVAAYVEQYRAADEQEGYWTAKKNEAKGQIIVAMADAEALTIGGVTAATYKAAKDSLAFDEKRFAAEHPDLYAQYRTTKPGSRRFLVKKGGR